MEKPFDEGLTYERSRFVECSQSEQSAALRHIFFALDEMSLELPGGATMECIWLEPGIFTIVRPPSDDE